ncbi:MAG TPA: sigma-70 family RNA polymerase sigma factor [Polyangia bacterium]|nr:sigma-70 family RNA polymerase sigma factor [Polyangia bacterium]
MPSQPQPSPSRTPARPAHESGCGCADRDGRAFLGWVGELVHRHRAELAAVARAEGLTAEDAVDAVQDAFQTFLTLPAAHPLVDAGDESRRLLITLTRNVARNGRRLHARARPHLGDPAVLASLPADAAGADDLIAAAEDQVRLHHCVQTLAEIQRAVVTLRMLDEVPGEDVATALGITPGHVAVLLHRAKANLLTCMTR